MVLYVCPYLHQVVRYQKEKDVYQTTREDNGCCLIIIYIAECDAFLSILFSCAA